MADNAVVWFKNDLRLRDNAVLHSNAVQGAKKIMGVYCFDDRFENARTRKFRVEAVYQLRQNWQTVFKVPLLVFHGKPEEVLPQVVSKINGKGTVICSAESASYETKIESKLEQALRKDGWALETVWNYSMYHPNDLGFDALGGQLTEPFTVFRKQVESQQTPIRKPLVVPRLNVNAVELKDNEQTFQKIGGSISDLAAWASVLCSHEADEDQRIPERALRFTGGEDAAMKRLENFVSKGLANYKSTRNESIGWDYSTKLSPWLAAGCVSPRQIHHRIVQYEEAHGESVHTYWVTFELLWRDYLRFFAIKHGNKIFFEDGPAGLVPKGMTWGYAGSPTTDKRFKAWKDGRTGVPWVDGHMRELKHTGFMSNRGRQNVASFLIFNLQVDWRLGAQYFEDTLIDHDVSANWCNWVTAAGVAFRGQRVNRFNMDKQARDYDPQGLHAKMWIPELKVASGQNVHDLAKGVPGNTKLDGWVKPSGSEAKSSSDDMDTSPIAQPYPPPIVSIKPSMMDPSKMKRTQRAHRGRKRTYYTN